MPTVLIVDEQEHMRRLLRSKFEREGFRVLAVASIEDAERAVLDLERDAAQAAPTGEGAAGAGACEGGRAGEAGGEAGGEATAAPEGERVALIVLDERLHDALGHPGPDRLRAVPELADVPMILLTPRTSSGAAHPLDAVLQMPFRPSQLVALAREAL